MKKNLILIFWDQLNFEISSLRNANPGNDLIFFCENLDDLSYVRHHKKKLVFLLSSMRFFAEELREKGFEVFYKKFSLNSSENSESFSSCLIEFLKDKRFSKILLTHPGEYRTLKEIEKLKTEFNNLEILEDDRFYCGIQEFKIFTSEKKRFLMEDFYRFMRKKHKILMDENSKPTGGKWNFDHENREKPKGNIEIPKQISFFDDNNNETINEIIELVNFHFPENFGETKNFTFATKRLDALKALDFFIQEKLSNFGKFQDAMIEGEPFMFHSVISMYINNGLLLPRDCVEAALKAFELGLAPLNSVEGFVRQILGWREFVRGIYWLKMPEYENLNFFEAKRKLPGFFWDEKLTNLNCLKNCIKETRENPYAHHIQRLMVLGNFLLLCEVDPRFVNEWYMIVYADAHQWVELPNVSGMILFADGGILASKPYAASGAYINKMSNYCKNCKYNVKEKSGQNACPFNYLYWNFLIKNKEKLELNQRLGIAFQQTEKMSDSRKSEISEDSKKFFEKNFF